MDKIIKIYIGDTKIENLFEGGLHPRNQVKKVINFLETARQNISVLTNSVFVAESFNKFGKEKDYMIECYFENKKISKEEMFNKFSKPFETLIFGEEIKKNDTSLGVNE